MAKRVTIIWRKHLLALFMASGCALMARAQTADTLSALSARADECAVAIKTNILLDALAVATVGVEVPVAHNWSVSANWMYGWLSNNHTHDYWRLYGGEVEGRYWLGGAKAADGHRALTGHHVGLYAQMITYDFELGRRGYMGGRPKGTLWDKATYGVGLSYGYARRISRRLNIDVGLGVGYLTGDYQRYHPDQGCYVYDDTKRLHFFGPTHAEVQIVWLLGHTRKGGRR